MNFARFSLAMMCLPVVLMIGIPTASAGSNACFDLFNEAQPSTLSTRFDVTDALVLRIHELESIRSDQDFADFVLNSWDAIILNDAHSISIRRYAEAYKKALEIRYRNGTPIISAEHVINRAFWALEAKILSMPAYRFAIEPTGETFDALLYLRAHTETTRTSNRQLLNGILDAITRQSTHPRRDRRLALVRSFIYEAKQLKIDLASNDAISIANGVMRASLVRELLVMTTALSRPERLEIYELMLEQRRSYDRSTLNMMRSELFGDSDFRLLFRRFVY